VHDDLCFASATELGQRYRRGEVSPVEVTRALLDRIERVNPRLNAFITVTHELALAQARDAERRLRERTDHQPLLGVPYTLKDLYATAGIRTTAGSRVLADWVPAIDATVHARLRAAGAILLGKTNTSEFAAGPTNANVWYGQARNPWRTDHVPGGSSGGAGAAVAAGLCPIGLGSDTGGSIRIPAALCGVVGLKATFGRVSTYGVVPLSWSQDHAGPLTRTVADAALVLQTIAGADPLDPCCATEPLGDYLAALQENVRGVRVGVPTSFFFEDLDPAVEQAVRAAIDVLAGLGAAVREIAIPWLDLAHDAANIISWVEAADYHRGTFAARPADLGPDVQDRVLVGTVLSGVDYVRAQRVRAWLRGRCAELFERVDVLATPTTAIPAPLVGAKRVASGGREVLVRPALSRLTRLANVTGLPSISVPCGFSADGLPIGLQLTARAFGEAMVLRVAHAYERATAWSRRRPSLA
jgi:aspartyl-tRNA(Asn)/glutamyl-tRNA(Gln) amidotransferase subunit A